MDVKRLGADAINEFTDLIRLFEEVFGMKDFVMPDRPYLQALLRKDDFIVFVAIENDEVIGGLTAYVLHQYYSTEPLAYIYDLAVRQQYQRRGAGRSLISGLRTYCQEKGYEEVFVQADKVDEHAIDFYRSTGITDEEQVVHFYYKLI